MEIIDDFMQSTDTERNLGMKDYLSRKEINDYCHKNNLHTLSVDLSDQDNKKEFGTDMIKEMHVSKNPFKITDPLLEQSIVHEINFMLDTKQYNTLNDLLTLSTEDRKIKITKFLEQFSFIYSNNYTRLFEHRKIIVKKARNEISKIVLPELKSFEPIKSLDKRVFTVSNHDKNFIRFDMINAVSSIIGIRDWKAFMAQFTKMELYISSKPLRGYIMNNIHKYCMKLVEQHVNNFINCIPIEYKQTYLQINCDEVILAYDSNIDYDQLMNNIDPDKYFRSQIFNLKYEEDENATRYIETYPDGTQKIKCYCPKSTKPNKVSLNNK